MASAPHVYLDACCFIDVAKQAIQTLPADRANDVWFLWQYLRAHEAKDVRCFTSALTIAECTHADGVMDQRVRDMFTRLLMSGQYVTLVQPTPFLAADARDLRWKHDIVLRGADYIHVASALSMKCAELLTTDKGILAAAGKLKGLSLVVTPASKTQALPDKYRQEDIFKDGKVKPIRRPGAA